MNKYFKEYVFSYTLKLGLILKLRSVSLFMSSFHYLKLYCDNFKDLIIDSLLSMDWIVLMMIKFSITIQ